MSNSIYIHDNGAAEYDQQAKDYKWYGTEILYGFMHDCISSKDKLLDIGIGTGLASVPFAKAGLDIYGIDGGSEMLKVCKAKNIAKELKQYNLEEIPLPYKDNFFDHIISCGVFHFLEDLKPLIGDTARLIKTEGYFAFTAKTHVDDKGGKVYSDSNGDILPIVTEGITIYMHNTNYIKRILEESGFRILKELDFFTVSGPENSSLLFTTYLAEKIQ